MQNTVNVSTIIYLVKSSFLILSALPVFIPRQWSSRRRHGLVSESHIFVESSCSKSEECDDDGLELEGCVQAGGPCKVRQAG